MKIISVPFLSNLQKYAREEHTAHAVGSVNQQQLDVKQALRGEIQRKISEIQALRSGKGQDTPRVQLIIDKFQSGKKLTPDEMAYLRQHAKGIFDHIERISREREVVEQRMRVAPSKIDVQNAVLLTLQQVAKHPSSEERIVRAMQIANAQYEYMQTDDFKDKPVGPLVHSEKPASPRPANKNLMQHTIMAIVAYEQAKLVSVNQRKV